MARDATDPVNVVADFVRVNGHIETPEAVYEEYLSDVSPKHKPWDQHRGGS